MAAARFLRDFLILFFSKNFPVTIRGSFICSTSAHQLSRGMSTILSGTPFAWVSDKLTVSCEQKAWCPKINALNKDLCNQVLL